ncbi:hypothetical protein SAMN05444349_1104 [Bacteroides faecichinchillae]|uniref:Uncharacterized protein n=1 Tax=Bacteroides faecichinchillae TaxID=871325 RepID=A0A1M4Y6Y3_9BACE|nr:hypothetical protein SAMN05444349_1104 [Bacteroides faecichinchillae]
MKKLNDVDPGPMVLLLPLQILFSRNNIMKDIPEKYLIQRE